ncbi:NHLP bacteriocin system secretion protein [Iningainema tapete]|uniref:NHLP bacteriocin system secretion protein n=1 Tax=Iningainema tapete BLCC-T55 TaxID=2748662 RepID=A0A8J7C6D0_9CYAN|nr:NHLP bacteriocin system secretion protein [Iningainema tapete]MBD2774164.1 NHLP bacteriocin system secretion protein [Iningainema tapete BLCC-T55]
MDNEKLFRKESLERLSSPERLDQLMQVVNPRDWIPLTTLGVFVLCALIWSIFGRIPITENAPGVLIRPRKVLQFQSAITGQLKTVNVSPGQCVEKDYVLATIDPSEVKQQLEQQRAKRTLLLAQAQDSGTLQGQRTKLEKDGLVSERLSLQQRLQTAVELSPVLKDKDLKAIAQQRRSLEQRLRDSLALTPVLKNKSSTAIAQQKISLEKRLKDAQALVPIHKQRLSKRQELLAAGAIPADTVLEVEQQYRQALQQVAELQAELKQNEVRDTETQQQYLTNLNNITDIQAQLRELTVRETQAQQRYLENINTISQLQAQLQEVNTKSKRLEQENFETSNNKSNEIKEVERNIAQLEQKLTENSKILSSQAGCVLEITASVGQIINPGSPIATINTQGEAGKMLAITYFPVKDGKKIKQGMPIQVTPDTVKRERFGGIIGKVVSVSSFPITPQGAGLVLGNSELVSKLTAGEPRIEVTAELELDKSNSSGYRWSSSKGPKLQISTGTTTMSRVQVEQQAPITFVLPILREWTGIN